MLIVKSSSWTSPSVAASVPETGSSPSRSIVTERSRSRYGTRVGSVIPARVVVLVEREEDGLAAHREVAPLGEALVVLGHQDAAEVRVSLEDHPEHVVDLALLEVRRWIEVDHAAEARLVDAETRLHVQAVGSLHREQLVVHAEARLLGQVVTAMEAHEERPGLVVGVAQISERVVDRSGRYLEGRLPAVEGGARHGVGGHAVAHALRDQLETRG